MYFQLDMTTTMWILTNSVMCHICIIFKENTPWDTTEKIRSIKWSSLLLLTNNSNIIYSLKKHPAYTEFRHTLQIRNSRIFNKNKIITIII